MADAGNAHVRRKTSKRQSDEVQANDAKRLLADPAYVRGYDNVHRALTGMLENFQHSGSTEDDEFEREICRSLRTLARVKRAMAIGIQGQALREADFRPKAPEKDE